MQSECLIDASVKDDCSAPRCHACGASQLRHQFSVPLVDGPHRSDKRAKDRKIYECDLCAHLSADLYDSSQYADYYESLSTEYHGSHDSDQSRYQQILDSIPNQSVKRALDIGCGTGTFLAMLPPDVERFGIEPSRAAARYAQVQGVKIVGYADLMTPDLRNTFDLVTAIDVIEHISDLQSFHQHAIAALRPGGILVLLTGNTASRSARWLGSYWSYLHYAEHVSFFSPQSIRSWLQPDFSDIKLTSTDHHRLNSKEALALLRIWLLFPAKWFLRKLLPVRLNMFTALSLPGDHMIVRAIRN
jgi:2-polyprenyl-3-methyl-5-hydroxy-6-metoxy-1,4-benzoquinol methylase